MSDLIERLERRAEALEALGSNDNASKKSVAWRVESSLAMQQAAQDQREAAARIRVLEAQLLAAWNSFGGLEPSTWETHELDFLPMLAGGGLDEQINALDQHLTSCEKNLATRDEFLVDIGQWQAFVASLPNDQHDGEE